MTEGESYSNILISFLGFYEYKKACSHVLFKLYIAKRIAELFNKGNISTKVRGK